jgi:hypothetical protein
MKSDSNRRHHRCHHIRARASAQLGERRAAHVEDVQRLVRLVERAPRLANSRIDVLAVRRHDRPEHPSCSRAALVVSIAWRRSWLGSMLTPTRDAAKPERGR